MTLIILGLSKGGENMPPREFTENVLEVGVEPSIEEASDGGGSCVSGGVDGGGGDSKEGGGESSMEEEEASDGESDGVGDGVADPSSLEQERDGGGLLDLEHSSSSSFLLPSEASFTATSSLAME